MTASIRGKNVAIVGGVCQLVFIVAMLAVWLVTGSLSALAVVLALAGGVGLWLVASVLLYCRQLARRESMELKELAAGGPGSDTIFEGAPEGELRPAAVRLERMERWAPPVFTVLWCAYNAAIGVLMLRYLARVEPPALEKTGIGLLFTFLVAFACFLFSRYCTGMGTQPQWRLLRAPGSFLLVNVLFAAGVAASLIVGDSWPPLDRLVAVVAMSAQLVLAVELLANLVMGFYRPRMPGREERFSFDSRLCSLVAEPERMGHSIAETLNYQFGFEVSKTWFYRLVAKAFLPLIAFGVLVLWAMSSIIIVRNGERAVVLHWGRPHAERRTLGSGMHFKWPWPIDSARRFSTTRVYEVWLGLKERTESEKRTAGPNEVNGRRLELWTGMHIHKDKAEEDFILASPREKSSAKADRPQVSIIKLVALIRYVIGEPYKYGYRFVDPHKMIECLASREMVRYCASATLDMPAGEGGGERPEAIMTYGRQRAADELKRRIQKAVSAPAVGLGVEIVYVGLRAVHPPPDAADAFEKVITARHEVNQKRYGAEAKANRTLTATVGSPERALDLALSLRKLEQLKDLRLAQDSPDQMRALLDRFIDKAQDNIKTFNEEIQAELLLGKTKSYRHDLRDKHRTHLKLLMDIKAAMETGKGDVGTNLATRVEQTRGEAERKFEDATGQAEAVVAAARGKRWQTEMAERSRLDAFRKELPAYEASPNLYMLDRWLDVWDKVVPGMPKYVIGVDRQRLEIWLNLEREGDITSGLYEPKGSEGSD